jgi:putative inorganic carbon (hco3(-)) transporter
MLVAPVLWMIALVARRGVLHTERRDALPATPLNAPLMLLMFMVLVSVIITPDLAFSLPKVAGMVLGIGAFFAVARESRSARGFRWALLLFVAIGVGVAALGLAGTNLSSTKIAFLIPFTTQLRTRLGTPFAGLLGSADGFNANEVAGALLWVAPVVVCATLGLLPSYLPPSQGGLGGVRLPLAIGGTLSALFILAVIVLTQSRAAYIALAITAPALLFIALPRMGRWLLLALLTLALLGAGYVVYRAGPSQVAQRLGLSTLLTSDAATADTADQGNALQSMEGRAEVWSRAIYGIEDFPFTGMGMNSFRRVVHLLYPLFLVGPDSDVAHAHNEFLQAALDLGLPGLIAFAALYIVAFWMLWRTWRARGGTPIRTRAMALGLGGGLFAHMIYGMVDAVALGAKPGLLLWMLLGLIYGLFSLKQE